MFHNDWNKNNSQSCHINTGTWCPVCADVPLCASRHETSPCGRPRTHDFHATYCGSSQCGRTWRATHRHGLNIAKICTTTQRSCTSTSSSKSLRVTRAYSARLIHSNDHIRPAMTQVWAHHLFARIRTLESGGCEQEISQENTHRIGRCRSCKCRSRDTYEMRVCIYMLIKLLIYSDGREELPATATIVFDLLRKEFLINSMEFQIRLIRWTIA